MLLIPYAIETLEQEKPTANRVIMGICVAVFLAGALGILSDSFLDALVLRGFHPAGLVGHMFVHAGLVHLLGNMLFLWVFGNAICANTGNVIYPLLYLTLGVLAALFHLAFDGSPAVGASGAINGITGIVVAVYPLNRLYLLWVAPRGIARGHNFLEARVWAMVVAWLLFDILFMVAGAGGVAYWAHIGGFVAGVTIGLVCLQAGWVQVTGCDNRTLLEIIRGSERGGTPRAITPARRCSADSAKVLRFAGRSHKNQERNENESTGILEEHVDGGNGGWGRLGGGDAGAGGQSEQRVL